MFQNLIFIAFFQAASGEPAPVEPTAETAPATDVEEVTVPAPPEPVIRCRNERPTGSRVSERVCRTISQEEDRRENAQNTLERNRTRTQIIRTDTVLGGAER